MTAPLDVAFQTGTTITSNWLNGANDHVNDIESNPHPQIFNTLAESTGSSLIGYNSLRTVEDKLGDIVSIEDFGAVGDGVTDDTAAIQAAIDYAAPLRLHITAPAKTFIITPATNMTDEAGTNKAALVIKSGMHFNVDPGCVFKIANGVSTDLAPVRMSMFFSNVPVENITIKGLICDMNGSNNPISPGRATYIWNRYTNASICISGTPGGVAARADNVLVENCRFINHAGVSCIVMAQSNTAGTVVGSGWKLRNNTFYNVGLDSDDHSCVYGWATDVELSGNRFENPAMPFQTATQVGAGALAAFEIHGSRQKLTHNTVINFYDAFIIASNLTETVSSDIHICGNNVKVSRALCSFWSANGIYPPGVWPTESESRHERVIVANNTVEISDDTIIDPLKSMVQINSRRSPRHVTIEGNILRSNSSSKPSAVVAIGVLHDHWEKATQININNNQAIGVVAGLQVDFQGVVDEVNVGEVSWLDNDIEIYTPSATHKEIVLAGSVPGVIEALYIQNVRTSIYADLGITNRAAVHDTLGFEQRSFEFRMSQDQTNYFTATGTTTAEYTKVGEAITCLIDYSWSNKGAAAAAYFCTCSLLPYAVKDGWAVRIPVTLTGGLATDQWAIYAVGGQQIAFLVKNNATTAALISDLPASGRISGQFSYIRS